jgi:hypothetical protein
MIWLLYYLEGEVVIWENMTKIKDLSSEGTAEVPANWFGLRFDISFAEWLSAFSQVIIRPARTCN